MSTMKRTTQSARIKESWERSDFKSDISKECPKARGCKGATRSPATITLAAQKKREAKR